MPTSVRKQRRRRSLVGPLVVAAIMSAAGARAGYQEGVDAYRAKNYREAATQFRAYLAELGRYQSADRPEYAGVYLMLGMSLLGLEQARDALTPLQKALELKSGDAATQFVLGQAYFELGDYPNAAAVLARVDAGALPETNRPALSAMLSVAYQKSGRDDLALAQLEKMARALPNDPAAQFNYGGHLLAAGHTDEAVVALGRAAALDRRDPVKLRAHAEALLRQGRETPEKSAKTAAYARAVTASQELIRLESSHPHLMLLAEAQLGAQQYDHAIATLGQAIAKNANDWEAYFYLGQAQAAKADYDRALPPLQTALTKPRADPKRIWLQLGYVYEKQENLAAAREAYGRAGDDRAAARIAENERIARENATIDEQNQRIQQLEEEKRKLEREMQARPAPSSP